MSHKADFYTDNDHVYVILTINADARRKFLISLLTFGSTILYLWFWLEVEIHHLKRLFIPTTLASIVFVIIPWRYWLWNFFGKEKLVINAQTISHVFDYTILRTNRNTISHRRLSTSYESVRTVNDQEFGRLRFVSDNERTGRPEEIYHTNVLVSKDDLAKIREMILDLNIDNANSPSQARA